MKRLQLTNGLQFWNKSYYIEAVKYEVTKICAAFKQMGDDYKPGLTTLSVQQWHHVK